MMRLGGRSFRSCPHRGPFELPQSRLVDNKRPRLGERFDRVDGHFPRPAHPCARIEPHHVGPLRRSRRQFEVAEGVDHVFGPQHARNAADVGNVLFVERSCGFEVDGAGFGHPHVGVGMVDDRRGAENEAHVNALCSSINREAKITPTSATVERTGSPSRFLRPIVARTVQDMAVGPR